MKTVLITGSSSGIGRAAAKYFQKKNWNVAATMRSPEKETELAALPNVICLGLDVERPETIKAALAETIRKFGTIDAVVNNAGFSLLGPFETTPVADIQRQFDTNLFGLMNVVREALPHFRCQDHGTFVNVASVGGRVGFPLYSLYNSTKFAVEGFSEALQHELRQFNIRVKIIEPGVIRTDFYGRSMVKTEKEGEGLYGEWARRSLKRLMAFGNTGITPEAAAPVIFKAASSNSRRLRYAIGGDAKMLLFIRRLFPFRFLQWVLRRVM